jgi:4-hydroxythreonine-4-phosphate dehydrogenase
MIPLVVTMGDPAGIGPEIAAGAWRALRHTGPAFAIIADPACFSANLPTTADRAAFGQALPVIPLQLSTPAVPGRPDGRNAAATIASIERAVAMALAGEARGVVTNPIAKSVLQDAGFPHPGHTEFLAALTGCVGREIMMLASPMLRVVPVTVHMALREALDSLTAEAIVRASLTTAASLTTDFGIARPRLAIAGLNPHAGEDGHMGREEITLIRPAIEALRAQGLAVSGPWPPDTMFTARARTTYEAAVCMYHDQALIPLKTLDMEGGVNVTLGLPIVRTSPDHGTAFDIAGRELADPSSLIAAIRLADAIAGHRGYAA